MNYMYMYNSYIKDMVLWIMVLFNRRYGGMSQ